MVELESLKDTAFVNEPIVSVRDLKKGKTLLKSFPEKFKNLADNKYRVIGTKEKNLFQ